MNLVVDVAAATAFLEAIGVAVEEMPPEWSQWSLHHRTLAERGQAVDVDLDGAEFARWWGGIDIDSTPSVVVNLHVDEPDEVDRLHQRAVELGARSLKEPWDAFWGSRYGVVMAPGPLCLGLMSVPVDSRRSAPPEITDFA